jgi:Fic family protein
MVQQLEILLKEYTSLNLSSNIDYDKFNQFAITHHSTTIEGSTLTEIETRLLLDEGITPSGKPLLHSLMVQDHFQALQFILGSAQSKTPITSSFIQAINAKLMRQTGNMYETVFGPIDASKGAFRKGNVSAGNTYFVGYEKVEGLVIKLCNKITESIPLQHEVIAQLNLSIDAHFDLVTIHPFYDGNGRTSRLLMNYIQQLFGLPLAIVFKEDKALYFEALQQTRKLEDLSVFRNFMHQQYSKYLIHEIEKYKSILKPKGSGGYSFVF